MIESIDEFTRAYIHAALWSTNDESTPQGGEPLEDNYSENDLSPEALAKVIGDCKRFQEENAEALSEAYALYAPRDGFDGPALAGHDFWLTRNGHGVGFWDRSELGRNGDGGVGDKLSAAARAFGECWITVGDDEQLHGF